MRTFFGFCLIILGVVAIVGGFYLGIVHCWVGGIVDIVNAIKAPVTDPYTIAWGLAKFFIFAQMTMGISCLLGIVLAKSGMDIWDGPKTYSIKQAVRNWK